jgi:hypothetical protein
VDNFERLNHIEEGSYGWVSRAKDISTGEIVNSLVHFVAHYYFPQVNDILMSRLQKCLDFPEPSDLVPTVYS